MSKLALSPELQLVIETATSAVLRSLLADPPPELLMRSRLLAVNETCLYLKCSRATLHRLEEAGVLTPKRFGRKVVYDRADLDAYIECGDSLMQGSRARTARAPPPTVTNFAPATRRSCGECRASLNCRHKISERYSRKGG